MTREEIITFLDHIPELNNDDSTYTIFDTIDRLLLDGKFDICNNILELIDVDKFSVMALDAFLVITKAASHKLPARVALFDRAYEKFKAVRGEDIAKRLLARLQ